MKKNFFGVAVLVAVFALSVMGCDNAADSIGRKLAKEFRNASKLYVAQERYDYNLTEWYSPALDNTGNVSYSPSAGRNYTIEYTVFMSGIVTGKVSYSGPNPAPEFPINLNCTLKECSGVPRMKGSSVVHDRTGCVMFETPQFDVTSTKSVLQIHTNPITN